mmetsp:Transcript_2073/g.4796  ORF Transcript_2073/g.4796 Transcript_2073/m.4796 type:complete len:461 (-) Transcript_2073:299-1681(-)
MQESLDGTTNGLSCGFRVHGDHVQGCEAIVSNDARDVQFAHVLAGFHVCAILQGVLDDPHVYVSILIQGLAQLGQECSCGSSRAKSVELGLADVFPKESIDTTTSLFVSATPAKGCEDVLPDHLFVRSVSQQRLHSWHAAGLHPDPQRKLHVRVSLHMRSERLLYLPPLLGLGHELHLFQHLWSDLGTVLAERSHSGAVAGLDTHNQGRRRLGEVDVCPGVDEGLDHGRNILVTGMGVHGHEVHRSLGLWHLPVLVVAGLEGVVVTAVVCLPLPNPATDAGDLSTALTPDGGHSAAWAGLGVSGLFALKPILTSDAIVPVGDLAAEAEPLPAARGSLHGKSMHPSQLDRETTFDVGNPDRSTTGPEDLAQLGWRRPSCSKTAAVLLQDQLHEIFGSDLCQEEAMPTNHQALPDADVKNTERITTCTATFKVGPCFITGPTAVGEKGLRVLSVLRNDLLAH